MPNLFLAFESLLEFFKECFNGMELKRSRPFITRERTRCPEVGDRGPPFVDGSQPTCLSIV